MIQRAVFLHEPGGVQKRPSGGDLFPAGDDAGLRPFFRRQHRVHDLPDLPGKDHVLDAAVFHFRKERFRLFPQLFKNLLRDAFLPLQQLIQREPPYGFPQSQLRRHMELFRKVVDLRQRPDRIRDPVAADKIEPQAHLIPRQDLLSGNRKLRQPGIEKFRRDLNRPVPEPIDSRFQNPHRLPVEQKSCLLIGCYLHRIIKFPGDLPEKISRHTLPYLRVRSILQLEPMLPCRFPESVLPGSQNVCKCSVNKVKPQLLILYLCCDQLSCRFRIRKQHGKRTHLRLHLIGKLQDLNTPVTERPVFSRIQKPFIPPIFKKKPPLIVLHNDLFHIKTS